MNRLKAIKDIRKKLKNEQPTIGSWIQIPHSSIAEIMGQSNYDWVAIDMEHGAINVESMPDLFRALELGGTLPLARIAQALPKDCKQALDSGAGGVIVPMIDNADQLVRVRNSCCWPPAGTRGVAFSRGNMFGKYFENYKIEAQKPLLVAMIESNLAIKNLDEILSVDGLDAIMIGPYDLSASLGITAKFSDGKYIKTVDKILNKAKEYGIAAGVHVVEPSKEALEKKIAEGYSFLAYSIDSVMLRSVSELKIDLSTKLKKIKRSLS